MNKTVVALLALGAGCVGATASVRRMHARADDANDDSQFEINDRAVRALELVDQGIDEAIREGRPIVPEDIHDHVRRGHDFDDEWNV